MDAENKIQKCSTCGEAFIAGVVNGKQLNNCRTCRDKKNKRKTPSETQETEKSQPPSDDEQPRFIPPTYEQYNNHYSNIPLCRPEFLIPTQDKSSQSIKHILTNVHDSLTHKSPNTCANDMLNDIENHLTVIENDTYVR